MRRYGDNLKNALEVELEVNIEVQFSWRTSLLIGLVFGNYIVIQYCVYLMFDVRQFEDGRQQYSTETYIAVTIFEKDI